MQRIIIADDEIIIASQIGECLTANNYEVVGIASTGVDAVEMALDLKPDLMLMDIVMPGKLDGISAAAKINKALNIPVIFLTLMDIYGRWLGIHISGLDQRMNKILNRQFTHGEDKQIEITDTHGIRIKFRRQY